MTENTTIMPVLCYKLVTFPETLKDKPNRAIL